MPRLAFEPERIAVGMAFACINGHWSFNYELTAGRAARLVCSTLPTPTITNETKLNADE